MIRFATSALVLALAAGSVALADPPRQTQDRGHDRQHDYRDYGRNERGGYDRDRHDRGYRYGQSGGGYYGHRWQRGEWLPPAYRARYYYAPDYRRYGYRMYAPPPGCRWVRDDEGDLLLMALATGLVLDVIYDGHY